MDNNLSTVVLNSLSKLLQQNNISILFSKRPPNKDIEIIANFFKFDLNDIDDYNILECFILTLKTCVDSQKISLEDSNKLKLIFGENLSVDYFVGIIKSSINSFNVNSSDLKIIDTILNKAIPKYPQNFLNWDPNVNYDGWEFSSRDIKGNLPKVENPDLFTWCIGLDADSNISENYNNVPWKLKVEGEDFAIQVEDKSGKVEDDLEFKNGDIVDIDYSNYDLSKFAIYIKGSKGNKFTISQII